MVDNIYVANILAAPGPTVTITDSDGIDWIVLSGSFPQQSTINLQWEYDAGGPISARAVYYPNASPDNSTGVLLVTGIIENARGSNSLDFISGNSLANIIYGDNDRTGPGGADAITGGGGNDTVYGGAGADSINGNDNDDTLYGDDGADIINGDGGIDVIEGGAAADSLAGGGQVGDRVSYAGSSAGVQIEITFGGITVGFGGDAQGDTIAGFDQAAGSEFADTIVDTVLAAVAFGGNNNVFYGLGGDDTLRMGGGNDTAYGGIGGDSVYGDDGNDMLYGNEGNDIIYGGIGGDTLGGGQGADTLYGGRGFDALYGGGDNDLLLGGLGSDLIDGGDGVDTVSYYGADTGVTVDMITQSLNTGHALGDTLVNVENLTGSDLSDTLYGDALANRIDGSIGDDFIYGRRGSDVLIGGAGTDNLWGGQDNDVFRMTFGAGTDIVRDFQTAGTQEVINLQFGLGYDTFAEVMTAGSQVGPDSIFNFANGTRLILSGISLTSLLADDFVFGAL